MIYVLGHNYTYTDVDSIIGSSIYAEILKMMGYEAKAAIINPDAIVESSIKIIGHIADFELPKLVSKEELLDPNNDIAMVDHNNPAESFGTLGIEKEAAFCIDHHHDVQAAVSFKRIEKIGSVCTILTKLIKEESFSISNLQAKSLVYGITCDTKGLKSRKTCKEDLDAIEYLYAEYLIDEPVELICKNVIVDTDIMSMTIEQILNNSLKEYLDGKVGIAAIEILSNDYESRMPEIHEKAWQTNYAVYVFIVFKQDTNETYVYCFDKQNRLSSSLYYDHLISRAHDIVPYVLGLIDDVPDAV